MEDWLSFATCFEVDDERVERALAPHGASESDMPRARMLALLERMADVARPRQGAARIFFVLARLARAEWLDGDLEIALRAQGGGTVFEITVAAQELRARFGSPLVLSVPFSELEVGVERIDELIAPLAVVDHVRGGMLLLRAARNDGVALLPEDALVSGLDTTSSGKASVTPAPEHEEPTKDPGASRGLGWGVAPNSKPTVKVKAFRIPPEAYREPPSGTAEETKGSYDEQEDGAGPSNSPVNEAVADEGADEAPDEAADEAADDVDIDHAW